MSSETTLERRSSRKALTYAEEAEMWAEADKEIRRLHEAGELGRNAANGAELRARMEEAARRCGVCL
ncbi:hypothetical protein [Candidatus Poriferisocius sp.]|uniref:hypothetical protein n=1 Tax=Candidatus Poriferisocius sp. TaxID=3101276 RepID=UPI003B0105FC